MTRIRLLSIFLVLLGIAALVSACAAPGETEVTSGGSVSTSELSNDNDFGIPTSSSEVPRITVEELKERLDTGGEIVVVDVRGQSHYEAGHIAGAVPAKDSYSEFPRDQEIVFYCA